MTYLQWWKINQISSLNVVLAERASGGSGSSWCSSLCTHVCTDFMFCVHVRVHAAVCALKYGRVCMCICKCFCECLSVHIIWPEALDSCQATVAGSSTLGWAATEQTLPHAYGFDKVHGSVLIC